MKSRLFTLVCTLCISGMLQAQSAKPHPNWVCESGYWVVESNKQSNKEQIIYFYSDQNVLVGKKTIEGKKLNLKRPRTLRYLKQELESTLQSWASR